MSWFKRNKQKCVTTFNAPKLSVDKKENILGEVGTIGLMFNSYTPNQEETIKQFNQARFIINNAETMYLRGIEDGTELNIDIAIKQLERVKQFVKIQTTTNEYTKRSNERVEITFNK